MSTVFYLNRADAEQNSLNRSQLNNDHLSQFLHTLRTVLLFLLSLNTVRKPLPFLLFSFKLNQCLFLLFSPFRVCCYLYISKRAKSRFATKDPLIKPLALWTNASLNLHSKATDWWCVLLNISLKSYRTKLKVDSINVNPSCLLFWEFQFTWPSS